MESRIEICWCISYLFSLAFSLLVGIPLHYPSSRPVDSSGILRFPIMNTPHFSLPLVREWVPLLSSLSRC